MASLLKYALEREDVIRPEGVVDVLLFYGIMASRLEEFLKGKEIASRIWLPSAGRGFVIKRGSDSEPLYADELASAVSPDLLKLRGKGDLAHAGKELSETQRKAWSYFVPRKLCDFFYATNNEGPGKPIERIFFDLDRGKGISVEQTVSVTRSFVEIIREDKELEGLIGPSEPFISWTGRSFHVMLFLDRPKPASFYEKHFQYSKNDPLANYTGRWVAKLSESTEYRISGGHEKKDDVLTVDPSQTPSGKLCRAPLGSLHMKDAGTVDGVSIPVTEKMLKEKGLAEKLVGYTPKDVLLNLEKHASDLPEKFLSPGRSLKKGP
jgi:hypothetical protein